MVIFRRKKDNDTWHSHTECSNWPTSDYIEPTRYSEHREFGEKCNECGFLYEFDKQAQDFYDTSPLKNRPHWYVIIRPTTFDDYYIKKDFPTYCKKIDQYSNNWDVWHYPYVDLEYCKNSSKEDRGFIQSKHEVEGHRQYWRFYRSGLFQHSLSFIDEARCPGKKIGKNSIIHTTTKIFNFAAMLAQNFNKFIFIKIQMKGIKEFALYKEDVPCPFIGTYSMLKDTEPYKVKIEKQALLNDPDQFAREAAVLFFKHFKVKDMPEEDFINVNNISKEVIKTIQRKCKKI